TKYTVPASIMGAAHVKDIGYHHFNNLSSILEETERRIILNEVSKTGGNLRKTAANLGIHRTTLYKKMDKLGIDRKDAV
ncbi:MAG TPA: helix-turn-helix domain-containing protein, partial [Oscillospiraceae bacterium]|nr:helix-turn-helix domain-containing protein [Oscillospiraceae bacterium]